LFSEVEAKEACDWLRAAGFPQYTQLYEGKKWDSYHININTDVKESLVDSLASTNICFVAAAVRLSDGKNQECGRTRERRELTVALSLRAHLSYPTSAGPTEAKQ